MIWVTFPPLLVKINLSKSWKENTKLVSICPLCCVNIKVAEPFFRCVNWSDNATLKQIANNTLKSSMLMQVSGSIWSSHSYTFEFHATVILNAKYFMFVFQLYSYFKSLWLGSLVLPLNCLPWTLYLYVLTMYMFCVYVWGAEWSDFMLNEHVCIVCYSNLAIYCTINHWMLVYLMGLTR